VVADDVTYNWRVTVMSERWQQQVALYLLTPTADAREAYDLAVAVVKSWPPGTRIVEIVPTERSHRPDAPGDDDPAGAPGSPRRHGP